MELNSAQRELARLKDSLIKSHERGMRILEKTMGRVGHHNMVHTKHLDRAIINLEKENEQLRETIDKLTDEIQLIKNLNTPKIKSRYRYTREEIVEALIQAEGVRERAAENLGINKFSLYRYIRVMDINVPTKRRKKIINGVTTYVKVKS